MSDIFTGPSLIWWTNPELKDEPRKLFCETRFFRARELSVPPNRALCAKLHCHSRFSLCKEYHELVLFCLQSLEKWNSNIFTWNLVKTSEWCNEDFWNWHLDTVIICNVTSVQQSLVFVWSICFWISNNSKSRRRQYISLTTRAQQRSRVIRGQKKREKKFRFCFICTWVFTTRWSSSDFLFRWNKN